MKKLKMVVSVFLVIVIAVSSITSAFAFNSDVSNEKISKKLKIMISDNRQESIPVYIFLKECDKKVVYENLENKYNYNIEAYENKGLYYRDIVPNITLGEKRISELINGKELNSKTLSLDSDNSVIDLEIRKNINKALIDDMNEYLACYRKELVSVLEQYISKFINDNKFLFDEIIYIPKTGEFIIAKINIRNINKVAVQEIVSELDYFENMESKSESWSVNKLLQSDSNSGLGSDIYNSGTGYDGDGIKIGVIEDDSGRYSAIDTNLLGANVSFLPVINVPDAVISDHATNVVSLICGRKITIGDKTYKGAARGATIIQTSIENDYDLYRAIDMLAMEGVNIINYSGGFDTDLDYHTIDKTVDNLLANSRILFVKSAGNKGGEEGEITSPGKAFNVLTVGNLETKYNNNTEKLAPYMLYRTSSYKEASCLSNKPDVVAPGSCINLPTTSSTTKRLYSGTSYAAPLVTAMAAQIMQSDCLAIFNPNAAKNYIVCGASNKDIAGTTVSYGALMEESGAGLVNAVNSYQCSNFGTEFYGAFYQSQNTPSEYQTIATYDLNKSENIRIALTFRKEDNILLDSPYGNNIDIRLVRNNPYSTYCVSSESTTNNVELIDTKVPSTGTYWLQIRFTSSILDSNINKDLHYWVSWRKY